MKRLGVTLRMFALRRSRAGRARSGCDRRGRRRRPADRPAGRWRRLLRAHERPRHEGGSAQRPLGREPADDDRERAADHGPVASCHGARRERRLLGRTVEGEIDHRSRGPTRSSSRSSTRSRARSRRSRTSSSATSRTSRASGSRSSTRAAETSPAAAYQALLARSYDALKAVDPSINVIGVGLSPRGNDNPKASGQHLHVSRQVPRRASGAAYRASGRTKPLMDEFAYHPYPRKDTDALTDGLSVAERRRDEPRSHQAGLLGRLRRHRASRRSSRALQREARRGRLAGRRRRGPAAVLRRREHRADHRGLAGNHLRRARPLRRLRSRIRLGPLLRSCATSRTSIAGRPGSMRADGTPRPSYDAVKATMAETGGKCAGPDALLASFERRGRRVGHVPSRTGGSRAVSTPGASSLLSRRTRCSTRASTGCVGRRDARVLATSGRFAAHLTRLRPPPLAAPRPGPLRLIRSASAPRPTSIAKRACRADRSSSTAPGNRTGLRCRVNPPVRGLGQPLPGATLS